MAVVGGESETVVTTSAVEQGRPQRGRYGKDAGILQIIYCDSSQEATLTPMSPYINLRYPSTNWSNTTLVNMAIHVLE